MNVTAAGLRQAQRCVNKLDPDGGLSTPNEDLAAGRGTKDLDCLRHEPQASSVVQRTARAQGHLDALLVVPADVRVPDLDELLDGR